MSKIGKKNITIPKESSIKIEGPNLTISGPKGSKTLTINDKIFSSKLTDNQFQILPLSKDIDKKTSIMWGTYRSLINNAIMGVSSGHEKILELNGVGFRANIKGESLNLQIGFSHEVNFKIPKEIKRISKPGRRVYSRANSIPRVMNGLGLAILSTPKGVMSDTEARKNNVGGEIICRIF